MPVVASSARAVNKTQVFLPLAWGQEFSVFSLIPLSGEVSLQKSVRMEPRFPEGGKDGLLGKILAWNSGELSSVPVSATYSCVTFSKSLKLGALVQAQF